MSDKLSHLNKNQIDELIERYYGKERVSDLIKDYNIDLRASDLVKHLPPEISEIKCPFCDINLIRPRNSKTYRWFENDFYCPSCSHNETKDCSCKNCKAIAKGIKQEEDRLKVKTLERIINEIEHVNLEDLNFNDKIYLGALLREGITEDYNYVKPINLFINPLAPTSEYSFEIINNLYNKRTILVEPNSDPKYINLDNEDNNPMSFNVYDVNWFLNVTNEVSKVSLIEALINPKALNEDSIDEAFLLWKKIALYECLEYFLYSVDSLLNIDFSIGEKTINTFKDILKNYSTAQVVGIIKKASESALCFKAEKRITRSHAANSIIGFAQSYAERAKNENWNLYKYARHSSCPQSALSKFFFERITNIGYDGFKCVPSIDIIKASLEKNT